MDFEDYGDSEEQGSGDFNATFRKKELKKFTGKLPLIKASKNLVTFSKDFKKEDSSLRAFVFYGPGDSAQGLRDVATMYHTANPRVELAVYEWPGCGGRSDEKMADNVDALVADAYSALKPSMEEVKEGAACEGAPFAFVGSSVGCQVMTAVAKKLLKDYGIAPCVAVVMNRAPVQFSLFSYTGASLLDTSPEKVVQAFKFKDYPKMAKDDVDKLAKGYRMANETREPLFHRYDCDVMLIKSNIEGAIDDKGKKGGKYRVATIKIKGSEQSFTLPVTDKTKVKEFLTVVGNMFSYSKDTKLNASDDLGKKLGDFDLVKPLMTIDGLQDFNHIRYSWPHPIVIIGAGFWGVKQAIQYHHHNYRNIVQFDRLDEAGGYAWKLSATKFSRIQTDQGAFNVWFGHEYHTSGDGGFGTEKGGRDKFNRPFLGPGSPMFGTVPSGGGTNMDANPVRAQVIGSLNYAMQEYGCDKICQYETEVSSLKVVGDPNWHGRSYKLGLHDLKGCPESGERNPWDNAWTHESGGRGTKKPDMKASVIYHFPGAYDLNRIVDYPGEDEFEGQIGYGMGSGMGGLFVWEPETMKGKRAAVLGNGAFAVENVRSCIECYASKVYIITRRKSLLCPRMPCWFCHQAPAPTPAPFLLDAFKPMYELAGLEDPWDFYAVTNANSKKTICCIKQSSRFGIGDVTFLASAMGLFEFRVGVVDHFTKNTIHLDTEEKLEDMQHVCKALGLIGDPRVDQLHAMTHRVGNFVNGDWRRIISADATGMDAMRFTTFSAGPGACTCAKIWYYMHQHPWEYEIARQDPTWNMIPKHTLSSTQPDQTIYMTNVQYEMHAGNILANCWGSMYTGMGDEETYKWCLVQTMHPTEEYLAYCKADWDRYQKLIKENCPGFSDAADVPYPYNVEMVDEWMARYVKDVKLPYPITKAGPDEATKKRVIDDFKKLEAAWKDAMVPHLVKAYKLLPEGAEGEDPMKEAEASHVYHLKKELTDSAPNSSMDFDEVQYDAWQDCMLGEHKFHQESLWAAASDGLLTNAETWLKMSPVLAGKIGK